MVEDNNLPDWQREAPQEKINCSSSKCEVGLHTFLQSFRGKKLSEKVSYRSVLCRVCGADIVDWVRIDKHDLKDIEYTVEALKTELFRRRYWARAINNDLITPIIEKGITEVKQQVETRVKFITSKGHKDNPWDGRQTKREGNLLYYAQHATATCCRKCIEAWHGINRDATVTDEQREYLTELIMYYIKKRIESPQAEVNQNNTQ